MEIQSFFGDVPLANFITEYLHRLPFSLAGGAASACDLGTWDALGAMLGLPDGDVFAVREGRWYDGPPLTELGAIRALVEGGHTVFVRHAERHHPGLAELAVAFETTFLGPVNIHMFVTPAGAPGFSWHYDAEDVFIIQTQGMKEYSLRKNTVNPWPLEETLPADMHYERELMPLMRVLLKPGDLLYIPCGYWHKAEAIAEKGSVPIFSEQKMGTDPEAAISLAVGVMSRAAIDVYDFLRQRLVESILWRQRLPLPNAGGRSRVELEAMYRQLFEQLGDDLKKSAADPQFVRAFLDWFEHGEKSI
ncbi:MAG TPA: cupin domain-containing protein [Lacipirellulaceae bacterium]|nr:cupin domain-containing protein [Lacipirellulaceae bacterium]